MQDQIHALEISLANQVNLPSVGSSHSEAGLHEEVFNILPGTVNQHHGAAMYNLQDQAFSFQKQVQFKDDSSSPYLKPDTGPHKTSSHTTHNIPCSSTPHRGAILLNRTFDISQMAPLTGSQQDAASIAAKVSAAAVAQVSKEFCHIHEPKIIKF